MNIAIFNIMKYNLLKVTRKLYFYIDLLGYISFRMNEYKYI